jgi:hypothetical protein
VGLVIAGMARHAFRILNVFAESRLAGNALSVFEDGGGLSDAEMQGLASAERPELNRLPDVLAGALAEIQSPHDARSW